MLSIVELATLIVLKNKALLKTTKFLKYVDTAMLINRVEAYAAKSYCYHLFKVYKCPLKQIDSGKVKWL